MSDARLKGLFAFVLGGLSLAALPPASHAAECAEPTGKGGCHTSIQAAVDAAAPGDKVVVKKGTYFENVVIPASKPGLQLMGSGSRRKVLLDGDAPNTGDALTIEATGVSVRNLGVVNGQGSGIVVVTGADDAFIDRVDVFGSKGHCIDTQANGTEIRSSQLGACGENAIRAGILPNLGSGGGGGVGTTVADPVLRNNRVTGCGADCLALSASGAELQGNRVAQAGGDGIVLVGAYPVLTANRVTATGGLGIQVGSGVAPRLSSNTVEASGGIGIFATCSIECENGVVTRNRVSGALGGACGFAFNTSRGGGLPFEVNRNQSLNNTGCGFRTDSHSGNIVLENNLARDNGAGRAPGFWIQGEYHLLRGNTSQGSSGDGFTLGLAIGVTLESNLARGNREDGFDVGAYSTNVALQGNQARDNLGIGFEVDAFHSNGSTGPIAANTVLHGNRASGNRAGFCDHGNGTVDGGNNDFGGAPASPPCPVNF